MTLIESILQGKPLNFAIDRAAVNASVRKQPLGIVLDALEQIANNHEPNHDNRIHQGPSPAIEANQGTDQPTAIGENSQESDQ